ncbi:efflux transporter periplasmic adaptor subunit (plasmid) [Sagittula sp. P11]|uniref:efflux RND transporter periplasmic adaptor subunit n=1 Tax=unclassified Sagittula TaxID=2624628 RepID=UPI000C2D5F77|nr:efflux RND transporter periplasmic adaptor subunit [Sagittula sp. P11]AUC56045.1 efflux transporter periplasmic adaptor subunit [Sagittula sp. P11]
MSHRCTLAIRLLLVCLLAIPSAVLAQEDEGTARQGAPRPVKLMTIEAGAAPIARQFFGRVRARSTVDLAFQVPGQIVSFPVTEGTPVKEGALVAQLDLEPFERELERARVNLAKAERDAERLSSLQGNAVAEVQVRDARTQLDLARIAAQEAESRLEDASLHAKFDALVARREVPVYTTVSAGQPVVRLHDMSELRVEIEVPEVLFRRSADYAASSVTFTASFPGQDREYALALREFEAETAQVAQTFTLTLAFVEEVPGWVLPGASVTVKSRADLEDEGMAILLPETALVFTPDRSVAVMVFEPGEQEGRGTVRQVPVEIEMREDARVALIEGPDTGTEIVATGASQLVDGQAVRRYTGLGN